MGSDKRFRDCNEEIEFFYGGMSASPSRSPSPSDSVISGVNCIIHPVSKFDTLAGVAIKYGVEVSDIKRLNGLVTDLQMFALKTIQIPLPGRHPPSPVCTTDLQRSTSSSEQQSRRQSDFFDSFQSLKLKSCSDPRESSAMDSLRGFYGLKPSYQDPSAQGCGISVYQNGEAHYLEDGPFARSKYNSNPPLSHHRKSKSVANCLSNGNGYLVDPLLSKEADNNETPDKWMEKVLRRRQKSEADFQRAFRTPEKLLKEEFSNGSVISPITGKGLALRPKSGNRAVSGGVDGENGGFTSVPIGSGDSNSTDSMNAAVRKSSSTSNLSDSENSTLSSIWPTSKWNLKSDFPIPIFDGLPKPMGRRNKAALD